MRIAVWFASLLSLVSAAAAQNNFVYTDNDNTPNTVSAFLVRSNGSLGQIAGSPFLTGGNGGAGNIDPERLATASIGPRSFLYAGNDGDGTISGFAIDRRNGQLTLVPGSPFPVGQVRGNLSLASSPDGQWLFATDEISPAVHVYRIRAESGTLFEVSGSPFAVGAQSQGLRVTANGRFLVVGLKSSNAVGVFRIRGDGALTQVANALASGLAAAVETNCAGTLVFNGNAGLNLIDVFRITPNGTLIPAPGSPFSNGTSSFTDDLRLSPDNRLLYSSDSFSTAISVFQVAPDGALSPINGSPFFTADWSSTLGFTRDGRFLYSALFAEAAVDGEGVGSGGTLSPVPGNPFTTGQPGFQPLALTTFPAPACNVGPSED